MPQTTPPLPPSKQAGRFSLRSGPAGEGQAGPAEPAFRPRRRSGFVGLLSGILTFGLVALVVGLLALGALRSGLDAPGPLTAEKAIVVPRGSGVSDVAERLAAEGVVNEAWWLEVALRLRGGRIQAGEFGFPAGASVGVVADTLVAGKPIRHRVTVREGATSHDIVEQLAGYDFLEGAVTSVPAEGSLLPETYFVDRGTTREALLARMQRDQTKLLEEIWAKRVEGLPLATPRDLVILASIVEKETAVASERPRVAGVYINRLRTLTRDFVNAAGKVEPPMTLDSDPTVEYGLTLGRGPLGRPLLQADTRNPDNPYNTYRKRGLPPGPIGNPGRASMEAVANPALTTELYFVADGTGGHAFAESLREHNRNVARWRAFNAARESGRETNAAGQPDGDAAPAAGQGDRTAIDPDGGGPWVTLVEGDAPPHGLLRLAQALDPPRQPGFDGIASYPVPPSRRRGGSAAVMEGLVPLDTQSAREQAARKARSQSRPARKRLRRAAGRDATEGTRLDPLRLRDYDLSVTQVVPGF
jgi:UPF0755 protein